MGDEFEDPFAMLKPPPEPVPPPPEHDEGLDGILALFDEPVPPPSVTTDPEGQVQRILAEVPEADPTYVRDLVSRSSDAFIDALLAQEIGKSARFVRDTILRQGYVTTSQVRAEYDPVAIFDLTRLGIPLSSERIRENGRTSKRYVLDPTSFQGRVERRDCLTSEQRKQLCEKYGNKCSTCPTIADYRVLQADHRVPFLLVGNDLVRAEGWDALKPACPSCNSSREDICAACPNIQTKNIDGPLGCRTCYWAYPEKYTHIAGKHERRATFVAETPETMRALVELEQMARERGLSVT